MKKIININGKTPENFEKEKPKGLYIPNYVDMWYNRDERSWVVQLKDIYGNQIDEAIYIHYKQEAVNVVNKLKKEHKLK